MFPDPDILRRACHIAVRLPQELAGEHLYDTLGEARAASARLSKLCIALAEHQREFERGMALAAAKYGPDVRVARIRIAE